MSLELGFTGQAAADLSADSNVGLVARYVGAANNRPTLNLATDPAAHRPAGFIKRGGASGAELLIEDDGIIEYARAGAVITPGTHFDLTWDATSRLVPATDGQRVIAEFLGCRAAAVGDLIRVRILKAGLSESFQEAIRFITLTASDEAAGAANAIDVTINVTDRNGVAVAAATVLLAEAFVAGATDVLLSEVGAGTASVTTAAALRPAMVLTTDVNGDAIVRVTFTDAGDVAFIVTPLNAMGRPQRLVLTFA